MIKYFFWSTGLVDVLSLTYTGNRLTGVSDAADPVILEQSLDFPKSSATMDYDSEGRLCKDTGRGIERITYAPNDMPMGIFGEHGQIKTQYAYSADGRKLSVAYGHNYTSSITDTRYYVGPIEFVKRSGAGSKLTVERVNLPWGYFGDDGSAMVNLTDYQGNIRAVTRGSEVVDRIDYYPYGLPKASAPGSVTRYRYSGKELETRSGLDHYDFHARLQLPSLGLFSRPDPKAADYPGLNPYLYCAANPIIYTDPTGEDYKVSVYEDRIVISANVYTTEKSYKSAVLAASFWNDQSGKYEIDGKEIDFSIKVIEVKKEDTILKDVESPKEESIIACFANIDPEKIGNSYSVCEEFTDTNINGKAAKTLIRVKESRSENDQTGAHELGHILGLGHYSYGLMTPDSENPRRSREIGVIEITDIIRGAINGKPAKDPDSGSGMYNPVNGNNISKKFKVKFR